MDKKSIAIAIGLTAAGWLALYPIYKLVKKNKELKKELKKHSSQSQIGKNLEVKPKDGSKSEKTESGKIPVEYGSTGTRSSEDLRC